MRKLTSIMNKWISEVIAVTIKSVGWLIKFNPLLAESWYLVFVNCKSEYKVQSVTNKYGVKVIVMTIKSVARWVKFKLLYTHIIVNQCRDDLFYGVLDIILLPKNNEAPSRSGRMMTSGTEIGESWRSSCDTGSVMTKVKIRTVAHNLHVQPNAFDVRIDSQQRWFVNGNRTSERPSKQ